MDDSIFQGGEYEELLSKLAFLTKKLGLSMEHIEKKNYTLLYDESELNNVFFLNEIGILFIKCHEKLVNQMREFEKSNSEELKKLENDIYTLNKELSEYKYVDSGLYSSIFTDSKAQKNNDVSIVYENIELDNEIKQVNKSIRKHDEKLKKCRALFEELTDKKNTLEEKTKDIMLYGKNLENDYGSINKMFSKTSLQDYGFSDEIIHDIERRKKLHMRQQRKLLKLENSLESKIEKINYYRKMEHNIANMIKETRKKRRKTMKMIGIIRNTPDMLIEYRKIHAKLHKILGLLRKYQLTHRMVIKKKARYECCDKKMERKLADEDDEAEKIELEFFKKDSSANGKKEISKKRDSVEAEAPKDNFFDFIELLKQEEDENLEKYASEISEIKKEINAIKREINIICINKMQNDEKETTICDSVKSLKFFGIENERISWKVNQKKQYLQSKRIDIQRKKKYLDGFSSYFNDTFDIDSYNEVFDSKIISFTNKVNNETFKWDLSDKEMITHAKELVSWNDYLDKEINISVDQVDICL